MKKGSARKTARDLALDVLLRVQTEQAFSPLALQAELEQAQLNDADRGLATEIVYGTLQWQGWLDQQLAPFAQKGLHKLQPWVLILLRLSVYQMTRLDRIPAHAAVNEAVNIAKRRGHEGIAKLVNGMLRAWLRQHEQVDVHEEVLAEEAQPKWLYHRWVEQWGQSTAKQMALSTLARPSVTVRINTLRIDRSSLIARLQASGYEVHQAPLSVDGLKIQGKQPIQHSAFFREGLLTIQDDSSMVVAAAVHATPEMNVLDACAAPGGKTTHMAQSMNGKGRIWALDQHPHKESLIQENVQRLGMQEVIRTKIIDARQAGDVFAKQAFDVVLLDAPCSGSGVLRRKPERKWRAAEQAEVEIRELVQLQADLLEAMAPLVKVGGALVYSTCSVDRDENDRQVANFLARHPEYELDQALTQLLESAGAEQDWKSVLESRQLPSGMIQLLPQDAENDGFFIARMKRI